LGIHGQPQSFPLINAHIYIHTYIHISGTELKASPVKITVNIELTQKIVFSHRDYYDHCHNKYHDDDDYLPEDADELAYYHKQEYCSHPVHYYPEAEAEFL